ncbi:MAG: hypothetical protein JXP34_04905 [Planctomycetes bacterium]|nr:hypothetical protein [Planctomycetota bacterium]
MSFVSFALAAPTDFSYNVDQKRGTPGAQVVIDTRLISLVGDIQGWSVGQCFVNRSVAVPIEATIVGTETATLKNGAAPDFMKLNILASGDGITQGVVIDFFGEVKVGPFPPDDPIVVFRTTYQVAADAEEGDRLEIDACATLGDPPVIPVVVIEGESIPLEGEYNQNGEVSVIANIYRLYFESDRYDLDEGATELRVKVLLETPDKITGFSFGVTHNESLLNLRAVENGADLAATNGGGGPAFLEIDAAPDPGPGATVGCLISMNKPFDSLGPGGGLHLFDLVYDIDAGATAGMTSNLTFTGTLDTPPVEIVLDASGTAYTPEDGTVVLDSARVVYGGGGTGPDFLRGDLTEDGRLTISDGVRIARALFQAGPAITCDDAADTNDDEKLDAADVLYLLNHLFLGGPALPAPSAACGPDDTGGGGLGCVSHGYCGA